MRSGRSVSTEDDSAHTVTPTPGQSSQHTANPLPPCQPSANPISDQSTNPFPTNQFKDNLLPIRQFSTDRCQHSNPVSDGQGPFFQSVNPLPILLNPGSTRTDNSQISEGTSTTGIIPVSAGDDYPIPGITVRTNQLQLGRQSSH